MEFTYAQPTKEEGEYFSKKLTELCDETSITLVSVPFISPEGKIDSRVDIYKKTPKDDGANKKTSPEEAK